MNTYALLNSKVTIVNPTEDQLAELVFMEDYDTVATAATEFSVGDTFTNDPVIIKPEDLSMSKFQAFYSLASFGLLDKTDGLARMGGTLKLREVWINESNKLTGSWTVRKCLETVELIKLLGISSADMDAIFVRGSQLDINNPKESLSELESQLFDQEMIIWDRKGLLSETDYVEMPSYDKPKDDLVAQRQVWRDEIRAAQTEIQRLKGN